MKHSELKRSLMRICYIAFFSQTEPFDFYAKAFSSNRLPCLRLRPSFSHKYKCLISIIWLKQGQYSGNSEDEWTRTLNCMKHFEIK